MCSISAKVSFIVSLSLCEFVFKRNILVNVFNRNIIANNYISVEFSFILYFGLLVTYKIVEDLIIHLLLILSYIRIFFLSRVYMTKISQSFTAINQSIIKTLSQSQSHKI